MTRSQQPPFEARQFQLIRNDAELQRALGRIEQLMDAQAGSAEGEELEVSIQTHKLRNEETGGTKSR